MVRFRLVLAVTATYVAVACRSPNDTPITGNRIVGVRFAAGERMPCLPCDMIVRVDSAEFHITETTGVARISPDSTWVVYTSFGGAGGYRGSGQALWRYDVKTGAKTQLMSEYFLVEQLELYAFKGGYPLLVVSMREPLQLVRHVAIIDPMRGEVFRAERAAILGSDSVSFTVAEWGAPVSWLADALNDSTGLPRAAPWRTYRVMADPLRQMAVLKNEIREWGQPIEFEQPAAGSDTLDVPGEGLQDPGLDPRRAAPTPQQPPTSPIQMPGASRKP